MEALFPKSYVKINNTNVNFVRYLMQTIDWSSRLIGIKGARGVGKTTLLLQYAKQSLPLDHQTLYTSIDSLYFTQNTLIGLAEQFASQGGKYLLLDEVHRYSNWSQEIKDIYDDLPDLQVIFTGSSTMRLNTAKGDLSRRAIMYELHGLSFREFLNLRNNIKFESISLHELIKDHTAVALNIISTIKPLAHFKHYLEFGYYPYFMENEKLYPQKLAESISLAIQIDLPSFHEITYGSIEKIRLLLHIIAESVPFKPNISKLSERIGISRNSLILFIRYLEDMRIINCLYPATGGIGILQKPEKIYLHHLNLQYALSDTDSNIGNSRESMFLNQLSTIGAVHNTEYGDFIFKDYTFEVGGKNKTNKQIKDLKSSFVVADEIEVGHLHKIPLWLFGFLY